MSSAAAAWSISDAELLECLASPPAAGRLRLAVRSPQRRAPSRAPSGARCTSSASSRERAAASACSLIDAFSASRSAAMSASWRAASSCAVSSSVRCPSEFMLEAGSDRFGLGAALIQFLVQSGLTGLGLFASLFEFANQFCFCRLGFDAALLELAGDISQRDFRRAVPVRKLLEPGLRSPQAARDVTAAHRWSAGALRGLPFSLSSSAVCCSTALAWAISAARSRPFSSAICATRLSELVLL